MAAKKKRTPKQIAATKKLLAFNKKRRAANPVKKKKAPAKRKIKAVKRKTNPVKKKAVKRKAPAKRKVVKRKKPTTVRRKPVTARKQTSVVRSGSVVTGLRGLKRDGTYTDIMYFNGDVKNVRTGWEKSVSQAAVYPNEGAAKKIANQLADKIRSGTRIGVASRNANESHIVKAFEKGGFFKKK